MQSIPSGIRYRIHRGDVTVPNYYSSQNFHGIEGGYLNSSAAVSYDPITQYFLPPNETLVRQALIDAIKVQPRRILDLGCGTGSTTLMLKQAFLFPPNPFSHSYIYLIVIIA